MERRTLLTGLLLACVIALTAGGIARLTWLGTQLDSDGPMALAAMPDGGFVLTTDRQVLTFDAAGEQRSQRSVASLGLQQAGAVQALADGSLWLYDKGRRQLFRCLADTCSARTAPQLGLDKNALFAVSLDHGLVAISDNNHHRLLLLDLGGKLLLDSKDQPPLHYPNQLRFDGDSLLIADSDRYVIQRLAFTLAPRVALQAPVPERVTRRRPYRFARDSTGWWTLEAGETLTDGALFHYGNDARTRLSTRAADAVDFLLQGDRLIIASRRDHLLLALDPASGRETELGSPALRASWQAQGAREAALRQERRWLPFGMIALLLPVLFGASLLQQQRQAREQAQRDAAIDRATVAAFQGGQTVTLTPDTEAHKALASERNAILGLSLTGLVAVPGLCWLSAGMPAVAAWPRRELWPLLAIVAIALPALAALAAWGQMRYRQRLARTLCFEPGAVVLREQAREIARAPLTEVTLSQTDLTLGKVTLPLFLNPQLRARPFWPRPLIKALLEARRLAPPPTAGAELTLAIGEEARKTLLRQRWMLRGLALLLLVPATIILLRLLPFLGTAGPRLQSTFALALVLPLLALWLMERTFRGYLETRLVLGATDLRLERSGHPPETIPYTQVWLGSHMLVAGRHGVRLALRRNNLSVRETELFPLDPLRDTLLARQPAGNRFTTDAALYLALLRQGNRHAWEAALKLAALVVLALALPLFTQPLKK